MTGQANFLQSLGWAVLNSLWQMALLWVVYQFIAGLAKTTRPAAKSLLATALLFIGFAWFAGTFIAALSQHTPDQAMLSSVFINPADAGLEANWLQQVLPVASVVYLLLLALPLFRFIRNYRYVQVIRKYGLTRMQVDWRMFVNKVAGQMGIKKNVQIWVSRFVNSPVTIGFFKPVILVPLAAINNLTAQQLEAVLLHELSHIRRHDYLVNLLINFIRAILYFNPFVKAFIRIIEKEREKSCDEMVLQFQYDSHDYASALLLLEKGPETGAHFTIGAAGKKQDLLNRIELILGVQKKPVFSFNKVTGLFAGLFCIIAVNALMAKKSGHHPYKAATIADIPYQAGVMPSNGLPGVYLPETEHRTTGPIRNTAHDLVKETPAHHATSVAGFAANSLPSDYVAVNYKTPEAAPVLDKDQEEQVKEALAASRKVLENTQWKAVEQSVADVFTQKEKEKLHLDYQAQMNKFDWKKWENQLRLAYDKVDWEKVNDQLTYAVNQVRMDSLQRVYSVTMNKLSAVEKELTAQQLKGIPDTDITLQSLEDKRRQAQRALNSLRAARSKKVVHL